MRISVEQQKQMLNDMMIILDRVARNNSIKYSLGGGTLLGAVRHKGFIPWDDDLDIMLVRDEYERYISCIKGQTDLIVLDPNEYPELPYNFVKVVKPGTFVKSINHEPNNLGVYIDVFPIDGLPRGKEDQFLMNMKSLEKEVQKSSFKYYNSSTNRKKKFLKTFVFFFEVLLRKRFGSFSKQHKNLLNKMSQHPVSLSSKVAYIFTFYNEQYSRHVFDNYVDLEFEGNQFMAISDFDQYLTNLYGDYMKLPPENKRVTHSFYSFYRKD